MPSTQEDDIKPGDIVIVPAGTLHNVSNAHLLRTCHLHMHYSSRTPDPLPSSFPQ